MWTENRVFREDMETILQADFLPWEKLREKTVLVSGATGLIGYYVSNALLCREDGIQVVALVRSTRKAEHMYAEQRARYGDRLCFLEGSLEKFPAVPMPLDYIVHAASPTESRFFAECPVETAKSSVEGMLRILELAREKQVQGLIYLSSMEVYGAVHKGRKIDETTSASITPLTARSSYPVAKCLCENLCISYQEEYHVPVNIVRLTQTFGPGVRKGDQRIFAYLMECCRQGRDIVLLTEGKTCRSYLYLADAVTAILAVLLKGATGEAYNAANEDTYCSVWDMAHMVAHSIGEDRIKVQVRLSEQEKKKAFMPEHYMDLDTSKLQGLGWKPFTGLEDMFRRTMGACADEHRKMEG